MNDYNFGNFLCMLREQKGMTQAELAQQLSVTPAAVSKWENGESKPRIETLFQLAEILGVTAEELMAGKFLRTEVPDDAQVEDIRRRYDVFTTQGMRVCKPSEMEEMKLETPERYGELLEIIKKGEATTEEYDIIRKYLSGYFKRENMEVDEIYILRENISKGLVKLYPQLPENNMFNIDVDEIKYEMDLDEEER